MPFSWYKLLIIAINKEFNGLKMNTILFFLQRKMAAFKGFYDFMGYSWVFHGALIGF